MTDDINTAPDDTGEVDAEAPPVAMPTSPPWQCPKCDHEPFASAQAVTMHHTRMHGPHAEKWRTGPGSRGPQRSRQAKIDALLSKPDLLPVPHANGKRPATKWTELTDFRILSDADGGIWIAERVK